MQLEKSMELYFNMLWDLSFVLNVHVLAIYATLLCIISHLLVVAHESNQCCKWNLVFL